MKRYLRILCLLFWITIAIFIFVLSNQPGQVSYQLSSNIVDTFNQQVNQYISWDEWTGLRTFIFIYSRKFAHGIMFFLLSIVTIPVLFQKKIKVSLYITIAVNFVYAILDEIHQYFIPGRRASLHDIFIDLIGILSGALFFYIIYQWHSHRKKNKI